MQIKSKRNIEMLYQGMNFSKVLAEISAPELNPIFDKDITRGNFEGAPFKDTRSLICRQSVEEGIPEGANEIECLLHRAEFGINGMQAYDTPDYAYVPEVYNAIMSLAAALKVEQIGRLAVTKLLPGGHILPHRDFGTYFDHYDRVQLAIGGEGCYFRCGKEVAKMMPGEVWAFNGREVHEVWNDSSSIRYHIIVDFKVKGQHLDRWPEVPGYTNNMEFVPQSILDSLVTASSLEEDLAIANAGDAATRRINEHLKGKKKVSLT